MGSPEKPVQAIEIRTGTRRIMGTALQNTTHTITDNRRVVLIKSLATNNRFYALISPDTGINNADTVEHIPEDIVLGIAYPCLEDGLNDFAVIRTTYETLEYFPGDDEMHKELMEMINDARGKLSRRLFELRDRIGNNKAHFLGTDMEEFKAYSLDIVHRGYPRRNLDSMMKLNVFSSVAEVEGDGNSTEPLYHYEFRDDVDLPTVSQLPAREFLSILFDDVLSSVSDDANYKDKYHFDRNVFQKFIALMFVNYATTDPIFYGTNKADYGVSGARDMDQTPLYIAVAREIREIEAVMREEAGMGIKPEEAMVGDFVPADRLSRLEGGGVTLPGTLINEDVLLGPISSICNAARKLANMTDKDTNEISRIILADASRLIQELKRLGIVSPFVRDLGADELAD